MKTFPVYLLLICLAFSCSKKEIAIDNAPAEIIDESTLQFQEGFKDRQLYTKVKAILPEDKSILLIKSPSGEEELIKFNLSSQSDDWQAATWHRERANGNYYYHHEKTILFRQGHHDFAIDLQDGTLLYDEVRDSCPDSRITGTGYHYFSRGTIIDETTQMEKEIILMGDMREPDMPEVLVSPPYDSIGKNGSLGRIMVLHPFANETGEELIAIRYFDYEPEASALKDLFAVYNISQAKWLVEGVPLEYHIFGTRTIIADDRIYFSSQDYLTCLDINTGALKWVVPASTISSSQLLAFTDGAIFLRNQGKLQRRHAETGELVWETALGNIQRFILLNDKLFSIGEKFVVTSIENGEILHTYSSPYLDYDPDQYFGRVKELMGYYDAASQRSYVFINDDKALIWYESED